MMEICPQQTVFLLKLALSAAPAVAGCYVAESLAITRRMPAAAKFWARIAALALAMIAVCVLAAVLIWAMG